MGSDSSKMNHCCSCLEQTQVGDSTVQNSINYSQLHSKKLGMISLQQNNSILQDDQSQSRGPTQKHNLILIGEKQCGKTTFINQLMGNLQTTYPTQYPGTKMLKSQSNAFFFNEVDFEFYCSSTGRDLTKKSDGFIFLVKYDKNEKSLAEQISKFCRLNKTQMNSTCAVIINAVDAAVKDSAESIKEEVKKVLTQYSIKTCAVELMDDCTNASFTKMAKKFDSLKIAQAR